MLAIAIAKAIDVRLTQRASRSNIARTSAVYVVWGGISLLALFMFAAIPKMATKELAPKEDQGVIFGFITAPANATIDDTIRYADAAGKVFPGYPGHAFHISNHTAERRFWRNGS